MAMMQQLRELFKKRSPLKGHGPLDGNDHYKALQALGHDPSCALLLALHKQSRQKVPSVTRTLSDVIRNVEFETGAALIKTCTLLRS